MTCPQCGFGGIGQASLDWADLPWDFVSSVSVPLSAVPPEISRLVLESLMPPARGPGIASYGRRSDESLLLPIRTFHSTDSRFRGTWRNFLPSNTQKPHIQSLTSVVWSRSVNLDFCALTQAPQNAFRGPDNSIRRNSRPFSPQAACAYLARSQPGYGSIACPA